MKRAGGVVIAASFAWVLGMLPACSGRSVVIGGDPPEDIVTGGGPATGGVFPTGGALPSGGAFPSGGTGNPAIPDGGTSTQTGGYGGAAGSGVATGGSGAAIIDPYPYVEWEAGQGYRNSCPRYGDTWGFTCWNYTPAETRSCHPEGTPSCNACSCAIPCSHADECPRGVMGHLAECVESATTGASCFLACEYEPCPDGMTCTPYPGTDRLVCMWLHEEPTYPT